jgi:hypothetical protein
LTNKDHQQGVFGGLVVVILLVGGFLFYRRRRRASQGRTKPETESQGVFGRISNLWRPSGGQYQQTAGAEDGSASHALRNTSNPPTAQRNQNNGTVDRNTSVRSVITLPAYRQAPSHEERVLGREGERDGIDVIVDLPTQEDEEALREREMDTLYQIRLARRQELADRETRRQLRREAQERRDHAALATLRTQAQGDNTREIVRGLRETVDRIKDNRQRSVSSVSYADLGVAHHDGSRLRANSSESERVGLLADVASMAATSRPGAQSPAPSHTRGRSASSIVSIDSDMPSPELVRSGGSGSVTPRLSNGGTRAGSSPELVEADLGDEAMPPPEYEDVPLDGHDQTSPFDRSTTPLHEPPPDYPGPYRSNSQRTNRSTEGNEQTSDSSDLATRRTSRGVGGTPQLPSLRLGRLPSIVIEPSSALPHDDEH